MSHADWIDALKIGVPLVGVVLVAVIGRANHNKITKLEVSMNGNLLKLLAATEEAAHRKGMIEGREGEVAAALVRGDVIIATAAAAAVVAASQIRAQSEAAQTAPAQRVTVVEGSS